MSIEKMEEEQIALVEKVQVLTACCFFQGALLGLLNKVPGNKEIMDGWLISIPEEARIMLVRGSCMAHKDYPLSSGWEGEHQEE